MAEHIISSGITVTSEPVPAPDAIRRQLWHMTVFVRALINIITSHEDGLFLTEGLKRVVREASDEADRAEAILREIKTRGE